MPKIRHNMRGFAPRPVPPVDDETLEVTGWDDSSGENTDNQVEQSSDDKRDKSDKND